MSAINPIRVVETTTRSLRDTRNTSPFWDQAFDVVHKVHLIWKTVEKVSIYGNPDNFLKLLAGHSVQLLAGDTAFVKAAASAVMISTCIMACVKEEFLLIKEIQKLSDACFDPTHITPKQKWTKPGDRVILSPAFTNWLKSTFASFINQIRLILRKLFGLFKQLFNVSMRMLSAAEAFSFDPRVVKEGTSEIFVNLEKCHKLLLENTELLLDFLKEHQNVIEKILEGLGSTCSYNTILSNIERIARSIEGSRESEGLTFKKVSRFAFQHMAFGMFQAVNMHQYMPRSWIPPLQMEWLEERHEHPRFPPKEWVQIYDHERIMTAWKFKGAGEYRGTNLLFNEL